MHGRDVVNPKYLRSTLVCEHARGDRSRDPLRGIWAAGLSRSDSAIAPNREIREATPISMGPTEADHIRAVFEYQIRLRFAQHRIRFRRRIQNVLERRLLGC